MSVPGAEQSVIAQAQRAYNEETTRRVQEILASESWMEPLDEYVVDVVAVATSPGAEATLLGYLSESHTDSAHETLDQVVETIFNDGIQIYGVVSALGRTGIDLFVKDKNGELIGMVLDESPGSEQREGTSTSDPNASMLAFYLETALQSLRDEAVTTEASNRFIGLLAISKAALEYEAEMSKLSPSVIANRGMTLYLLLGMAQREGADVFLRDSEGFTSSMVPIS